MNWGAAFTGLGQGFPQGLKDAQGIEQQYEAGLDQQSTSAAGRGLQLLQHLSQQQQQPPPMQGGMGPPGMQPQGGMQPPMGGMPGGGQPPQMGGPPPMPQGSPPMGAPPGGVMQQPPMQRPMGGPPMGPQGGPQPGMQPPAQGGGGPQGGQQQGGGLDWRTLIMAIQRGNPGAPPQVLMAAVNKLVPLMNSQSMLEWRHMQSQLGQQRVEQGDERLDQGQQKIEQAGRLGAGRLQQGEERMDITREMYGQAPKGGGQQFAADFDKPGGMGAQQGAKPQGAADRIADQMVSGKAPPLTTGMYRLSGPVRAALAKDHPEFNLAQAQLEWKKAERMTSGLTSPQQVRFQQLGVSVVNTMDMAMEQAKKLQLSGITPLNKAKLDALISLRGNSPIGQEAAKYVQTVAFLKGEVANLENGGYAPTESSWAQARNVINENYGVEEFLSTMPNAQRLINYRLQAQQKVPEGMSQGTRYKVPQGPEAPAGGGGIPEGWSVKEH